MRSTILVIAMAAVSSVATAAQQGLQFPDLFSEDTPAYASLLTPEDRDLFTIHDGSTVPRYFDTTIRDSLLMLLTGGTLVALGSLKQRSIRNRNRARRGRARIERRSMA